MRRYPLIAAILLLVFLPLSAMADDDGGTESVFNLGAGARAMGMGNGYLALTKDATAVYYNPAAITYLPSQQISFLHTVLFEGITYDFVSYVYPYTSIGGFGIAGMRFGADDIGRRDAYTDLGQFSNTRLQILLSYGRQFGDRYSSGVNLKLAHQSIADYSAYGYGMDLAGRAKITEKLSAGVVFQDLIGARLRLVSVRERTPFTFRTGLAYLVNLRQLHLPADGAVTFDVEKPEKRHIKIRTGLEVAHESGLAVRAGFDRDNFTVGLGVRYHELTFDYAYKFIDRLMDSHRFSLSFDFGPTRAEMDRKRKAVEQGDRENYLNENRLKSYRREKELADVFKASGQHDSALVAYYRAEAFADDKQKKDVTTEIAQVKEQMRQEAERAKAGPTETPAESRAAITAEQARGLLDRGELKAAKSVVADAKAAGLESEDLKALQRDIDARISDLVRTRLREADQSFRKGDYADAYNKYQTVLEYDPADRQAANGSRAAKIQADLAQHLKLAIDYYDQERYEMARQEFDSVRQLDPKNETAPEYLRRIDQILQETASPEQVDLRNDDAMWQKYLDGVEEYRKGNYGTAIDLWNEVLKKYPNNKMTQENIRQAQLRLQEP